MADLGALGGCEEHPGRKAFAFSGVTKGYLSHAGERVRALHGVSFSAEMRSITCIVGPTGSGKSTLLRMASGLSSPDEGAVLVGGVAPDARVHSLAYLTQQHTLFPWLRVGANIGLPLEIMGVGSTDREKEILRIARLLGIEQTLTRYPHELSGGMQQRAALGRLIAGNAPFWLMDEPFAALDDRTSHQLQRLLLKIVQDSGVSLLFVTHAIDEAVFLADRVIVLSAGPGRVVDTVQISLSHPRSRVSPEFGALLERIRCRIESVLEDAP